jgi:hypothetical protein
MLIKLKAFYDTDWLDVVCDEFGQLIVACKSLLDFDGVYSAVRDCDTYKTAQNGAVANGAYLVVWTPADDCRFALRGFSLTTTAAGLFKLVENQLNGDVIINQVYLAANTPYVVTYAANGYRSTLDEGILQVLNSSGGASGIACNAWGYEFPVVIT